MKTNETSEKNNAHELATHVYNKSEYLNTKHQLRDPRRDGKIERIQQPQNTIRHQV